MLGSVDAVVDGPRRRALHQPHVQLGQIVDVHHRPVVRALAHRLGRARLLRAGEEHRGNPAARDRRTRGGLGAARRRGDHHHGRNGKVADGAGQRSAVIRAEVGCETARYMRRVRKSAGERIADHQRVGRGRSGIGDCKNPVEKLGRGRIARIDEVIVSHIAAGVVVFHDLNVDQSLHGRRRRLAVVAGDAIDVRP